MARRQYPLEHLSFGQFLPEEYKLANSLSEFKSKIKSWKCDTCVCWLCQSFLQKIRFYLKYPSETHTAKMGYVSGFFASEFRLGLGVFMWSERMRRFSSVRLRIGVFVSVVGDSWPLNVEFLSGELFFFCCVKLVKSLKFG